jgi:CubicO group peptidase (beta-lactamase class C family)
MGLRAIGVARGTAIGAVALAAAVLSASLAAAQTVQPSTGGPRFRADGPDADAYGRRQGYPSCAGLAYMHERGCRVGAFSHFDTLFPSRRIAAPASPSPLRRAAEPKIRYAWAGSSRSLDQYLDTQPVTGFLIAKGDTILVERYQYGRSDKHRLTSFSMAKTIIALLVGIAVEDGSIRSIDDSAAAYVPGLEGSEYGRTPIKALLQMSSGVTFRELYSLGEVSTDPANDVVTLANLTLGQDPGGSVSALRRYDKRHAQPGQLFSYASAESLVLGLVLAGATRRTVADYASEKLWRPLGAEAEASWIVDATGQEITFGYFNAVLRDWARLGLMLAHGGAWQGKSVVPPHWVQTSTAPGPGSPRSGRTPGCGFQTWLLMDENHGLALRGLRGQLVIVDPVKNLVLVQTALQGDLSEEVFALWSALRSQLP